MARAMDPDTQHLITETRRILDARIGDFAEEVRGNPSLQEVLVQISRLQSALQALGAPQIPDALPLAVVQGGRRVGGSRSLAVKQQPYEPAQGSESRAQPVMPSEVEADGTAGLATMDALRLVMSSEPVRSWAPSELAHAMTKAGWTTDTKDRVRLVTARLQKLRDGGRVQRVGRAQYRWADGEEAGL